MRDTPRLRPKAKRWAHWDVNHRLNVSIPDPNLDPNVARPARPFRWWNLYDRAARNRMRPCDVPYGLSVVLASLFTSPMVCAHRQFDRDVWTVKLASGAVGCVTGQEVTRRTVEISRDVGAYPSNVSPQP